MSDFVMPSNYGANPLIPIHNNDGVQAVMGRDLHQFLDVKTPYTMWINRQIDKYGFVAGQDFLTDLLETSDLGGRPAENHILTMDMAKELSMVQNNQRGRQARQYFIECERKAKQPAFDPSMLTRSEILQIALNAEEERLALEARNKELEPKADAYDEFLDATGVYSVGAVAKMLGVGQNRLFRELRNRGILISKGSMRNTPYQRYMRHFEVKAVRYSRHDGEDGVSYTTYVQPSGIDFIRKQLGLPSIDPQAGVA